ncbi:MAG: hypothetical protein GX090_06620 [Firmicutes bacterium]|nr:hypothetical protein [Bacillota bacterium]HOB34168.1 hypothetical protein [Bacillota bacterium]HPZ90042.1 hypothetical protein [Bacillota bacterium]HQE00988.1 hypothetical protein [Bacillota bacterium]
MSVVLQKKRRFRIDPSNPYRTRYMVYQLLETEKGKYCIGVEQYDFVLRSQVAEKKDVTPAIENERSARQLIEYMLERARNLADAMEIFAQWRKGNIVLISENKNILVKEAIRKRFVRNLRKL